MEILNRAKIALLSITNHKGTIVPKATFGGQEIEIKPLTLENCISLLLLMSPHLAVFERHWVEIKQALKSTDGTRSQVLFHTFIILRQEMAAFPGDITRAMALLLGMDIEWVARNVTAQEFLEALPVLDRVNNFSGLWQMAQRLGLKAGYING